MTTLPDDADLSGVPDDLNQIVVLDLELPAPRAGFAVRAFRAVAAKVKGRSFADDLEAALKDELGDRVKFWNGWRGKGKAPFAKGRPVAMVLHHTAGAATESTNPKHKGNQTGANNGVVRYVSNHPEFDVPCSNFCLDRDGTVYVMCSNWTYHAGKGSFRGKEPWDDLGVPSDSGNTFMLGVEIVSKGRVDDFTAAQWESLADLAVAVSRAARWKRDTSTRRLPRHKDYAGNRKVDIRASNNKVQQKIRHYRG